MEHIHKLASNSTTINNAMRGLELALHLKKREEEKINFNNKINLLLNSAKKEKKEPKNKV